MKHYIFIWAMIYIASCNSQPDQQAEKYIANFAVMGDCPYDEPGKRLAYNRMKAHLLENNQKSQADFLIHVGDIKRGAYPCDTAYFEDAIGLLADSKISPYMIIGDNEWNDCEDQDAALSLWHHTFDSLNGAFVKKFQARTQATVPTNMAFLHGEVLFMSVHQVSGKMRSAEEWRARAERNAQWIKENFEQFGSQAKAAIIFAHASPDQRIEEVGEEALWLPLRKEVEAFGKPVMYLQGDTHRHAVKHPYGGLDNFYRLVIDEDLLAEQVIQVAVRENTSMPFDIKRVGYFD
ncbi:metallophosphoesterase [Persicobacter diffluens]|uniref:Calcineurin-like phosphoesterase domain-containing protein n=1 Tax=Persicobacter diffluens TaxID=981 RepID=A0AAN5ALC3_9BACT|nr:hypothetical protein PEDI_36510 [Persicobacter diffluens]